MFFKFYHQPTKVRAKKLNKNKIAKVDKKIVAIDFPVCLNCIYDKKNKPKDVFRKYIAGFGDGTGTATVYFLNFSSFLGFLKTILSKYIL